MLLTAVFHYCTFLTWETVWRENEIATQVHQFQLCLLVCIHGSLVVWLYFEHCLAILMQGQNEEQAVKCVAGLMTWEKQWIQKLPFNHGVIWESQFVLLTGGPYLKSGMCSAIVAPVICRSCTWAE